MGSCISKCRPKPPPPIVHDKLVLVTSQQAKAQDPPILKSTHSFSPSSSCTTSLSTTTSTSFSKSPLSSTCSSSISSSNYTNDFLWSYGKENRIRSHNQNQSLHYSVKTSPVKSVSVKLPTQLHVASSIPSKRSRANSPTLTRQKSFKREPEGALHRGRNSPSRRFNCESNEAGGRIGVSSSPGRRGCAEVLEASRSSHTVMSSTSRRNTACPSPSRRYNNCVSENSVPQRNMVYSSPSRRFQNGALEPLQNSIPQRNTVYSSPSRRFKSGVSESAQNSVPQRNMISSSPSQRFHTHTSHFDKQYPPQNPPRNLGSLSPSRKYNPDLCRDVPKIRPRSEVGTKRDNTSIWSSTKDKENVPASGPWSNTVRDESSPMKTETCTHQIDTRTDQDTDVVMVSSQDSDPLPDDDIDNPLISLDCFIFI